MAMYSVMFEVQPRRDEWDVFFARAKMLRDQLEQAPGFVDHLHYSSLTRDGWVLSLSGWRDRASVGCWPTRMRDQEAGHQHMLADYRLRIGEVTSDTRAREGRISAELPRDDKAPADGTHVTLIDAKQSLEWVSANNPQEIAIYLGFDLYSYGDCISWDIFNSLASPGEILLLVTWKDAQSANDHAATQIVPDDARVRVVRIVEDEPVPGSGPALQDNSATPRATLAR
jgi:quinol monooxygenase YgiN